MRSDLDRNIARDLVLAAGLKFGVSLLTITADQTLVEGMPQILGYDPTNTNRNLTLFTPANAQQVLMQKIIHFGTGTGQLVIKSPAAATIGTLDPGSTAECYYINGNWLVFIDPGAVAAQNNASKSIIPVYTKLADLVNTNVISVKVPFNFTLTNVSFRVRTPATTAAKAATLTGRVNGVAVTGGVLSLTSANMTPTETSVDGTAITAGNVGTAGQAVGVLVSAVTAFAEGDGNVEFSVTRSAAP